ncbi:hypothetical protein D3C79_965580 [compost metagenome]
MPALHTQRPQGRQLAQPRLAQRQQVDEQRHAGHAKREAVERGSGGKGTVEHLGGPAFQARLLDHAAVVQGEALLQRGLDGEHLFSGQVNAQAG